MFEAVKKALNDSMEPGIRLERYTVPGVKDLPAACKILLEDYGCALCIALGMPGDKPIDKRCAHESSQGMIEAQLKTNKHIIEVFVHLDEGKDKKEICEIAKKRAYEHTINAVALLKGKETLSKNAGKGVRQGRESVGPLRE